MSSDSIPSNVTHLSAAERTSAEGLRRPPLRLVGGEVRDFRRPDVRPVEGEKKKFVAKGHDSQLQDAQYGKNRVRITLMSGSTINGTISRRDKFTITLRHEHNERNVDSGVAGLDEIIYKHAIEGVLVFPKSDSQG
jgi:sRNA-binding regulator protein Hfq